MEVACGDITETVKGDTPPKDEFLRPRNQGAEVSREISSNIQLAPMAIAKIKLQGAILDLPAKQHCQFGSFGP